jgi:hypothetical protein
MAVHHVYHWKHGWIPLDHVAALSKAKGNHSLAAKYLDAAHGPHAGIHSRRDVAGALVNLPKIEDPADRRRAHDQVAAAAHDHSATDLLPRHQAAAAGGYHSGDEVTMTWAGGEKHGKVLSGARENNLSGAGNSFVHVQWPDGSTDQVDTRVLSQRKAAPAASADHIAQAVKDHNWPEARKAIRTAIADGRADIHGGDLNNGGITRVYVDGKDVGPASSLLVGLHTTTPTGRPSGKIVPMFPDRDRNIFTPSDGSRYQAPPVTHSSIPGRDLRTQDEIRAAASSAAGEAESNRTTYRERRQAKAERLRGWADKREAKAESAQRGADQISDMIPPGQPILVGHHSEGRHRRDLERMHSRQQAAWDNSSKASEFRNRADNIEAAADSAIYSDDHDAIPQLEQRIADLEAQRDRIKAYNKTVKAGKRDVSLLDEKQRADLLSGIRHMPHATPGGKFPSYGLTNLSGNIARNRKRLEELKKRSG